MAPCYLHAVRLHHLRSFGEHEHPGPQGPRPRPSDDGSCHLCGVPGRRRHRRFPAPRALGAHLQRLRPHHLRHHPGAHRVRGAGRGHGAVVRRPAQGRGQAACLASRGDARRGGGHGGRDRPLLPHAGPCRLGHRAHRVLPVQRLHARPHRAVGHRGGQGRRRGRGRGDQPGVYRRGPAAGGRRDVRGVRGRIQHARPRLLRRPDGHDHAPPRR